MPNPFLESLQSQGFAVDVPGQDKATSAPLSIPIKPNNVNGEDIPAPGPYVSPQAKNPFMQVANDFNTTGKATKAQNDVDQTQTDIDHTLNPGVWTDIKNGFMNAPDALAKIGRHPLEAAQGAVLGLFDAGPAIVNTMNALADDTFGRNFTGRTYSGVHDNLPLPSEIANDNGFEYGKSQEEKDVINAFTLSGKNFAGYELGGAAAKLLPIVGSVPIASRIAGNVLGGQAVASPDITVKERGQQALFDAAFGAATEGVHYVGGKLVNSIKGGTIPPEVVEHAATAPENLTELEPKNPFQKADDIMTQGEVKYQPRSTLGKDANGQDILATTHFDYATGNAIVEYKASLDNAKNADLKQAVLDHEHGHILDNRVNAGSNLSAQLGNPEANLENLKKVLTNLSSDMGVSVSEASKMLHDDIQTLSGGKEANAAEAFAEAFRKYKSDPEKSAVDAPTFAKFMQEPSEPRFTSKNTVTADVATDEQPKLRDKYNKESRVKIGDKEYTLTGRANEEYVQARAEYKQKLNSMRDFAAKNPEQATAVWQQMRNEFDAKTREITGKFNPKETTDILQKESANYAGKNVEVNGKPGEIVGNPKKGLYTVRLEDGTLIKNIPRTELKDVRTPEEILNSHTTRDGVTETPSTKQKLQEEVKAKQEKAQKLNAKNRPAKIQLDNGPVAISDAEEALVKAGYSEKQVDNILDNVDVKKGEVNASEVVSAAEHFEKEKEANQNEPKEKVEKSTVSNEAKIARSEATIAKAEASTARAQASEARAKATEQKSQTLEQKAKTAEQKALASEARAKASEARATATEAKAQAKIAQGNKAFKTNEKLDTGKRVQGQPNFNPDAVNVSPDTANLLNELTKEQSLTDKSISKSNEDLKTGKNIINLSPQELIDLQPGKSGFSETALKARELWLNKIDDLGNWLKGVSKNSMTADQALELRTRTAEINAIWQTMRGFGTEASNALRSFGIKLAPGENATMAQLADMLKDLDPENAAKFRTNFGKILEETPIQTAGRKAFGIWYQAILSGPKTAARNFAGNTFNLLTQIASKLTNPNTIKEFIPAAKAFVSGFKEQTPEFFKDFKSAILGQEVKNTQAKLLEMTDPLDKGVWGQSKLARLGHWFEGLGHVMLSDKYISAVSKKVEQASLKVYSPEISDSLNDALSTYFAEKSVFHGEPGGRLMNATMTSLESFRSKFPPAKIIIPFVRTVSNIIDQQFDYLPISSYFRAYEGDFLERNVNEIEKITGYKLEGAERDLAKQRVADHAVGKAWFGTAIAGAAIPLAMQGLISGTGPTNYNERQQLMRTGWRPNSIRIGDTWIPYTNLGPLAGILSMVGNVHDAKEYNKSVDSIPQAIGAGMLGWMQSQLNSSFMQGAANLLDAIANQKSTYFTEDLPKSLIPVPALITQTHDLFASQQYQTQGLIQSLRDKLGLEGNVLGMDALPEKLDAFGEPMRSDLIYGLTPSKQKVDMVNSFLVGRDIVVPTPLANQKYTIPYSNKEQTKLTQTEYHDYVKTSGQEIYQRLEQSIPAIQNMTQEQQKKYVSSLVEKIRTSERNKILLNRKK